MRVDLQWTRFVGNTTRLVLLNNLSSWNFEASCEERGSSFVVHHTFAQYLN
jgi:hypothetical protein